MRKEKAVVILNPVSGDGKGRKYFNAISKWADNLKRTEGIEISVAVTEKYGQAGDAYNLAKKAVEGGCDLIISCGGDGNFNNVINGIMRTREQNEHYWFPDNVVVGIIPAGTGDNFAKNLNIPSDLHGALNVSVHGATKEVDLLDLNGKLALNVASFGLDAVIVKKVMAQNFLARKYAYLATALKEIKYGVFSGKMPSYHIELRGEGVSYKGKVILAAAVNGETYGGIFKIAPGAQTDDGKMDVCLVEEMGPIKCLWNIIKIIRGTHVKMKEVRMFRTSYLSIIAKEPLPCEIDGEVADVQGVYFVSVLPRKLKIRVPYVSNPGM